MPFHKIDAEIFKNNFSFFQTTTMIFSYLIKYEVITRRILLLDLVCYFFKNSHMEEVENDIFILNSDWRVINPCHSSRAIRRREGRFPLSLVPSFIYTILLLISQLSTWANVRAVSYVSTYFFTILYILTRGSIEISTTVRTHIFLISDNHYLHEISQ